MQLWTALLSFKRHILLGVEKSMKNHDLVRALNLESDIAVSIYAPTHRTSPENLADRIVVKNLVSQALEAIEALGDKREHLPVVENLQTAFESIDWSKSLDGIGLLVSAEGFWKYDLEHSPEARVTVGAEFAIAELSRAASHSWEYYLLVLSESPTRLFIGDRTELTELKGDFPITHNGRGGTEGKPTGFGKRTSVILDEVHRQFFREISEGLTKAIAGNGGPLPLVVTGVERFLAFWDDVAPEHRPAVSIEGSYDYKSEADLIAKLWTEIEGYFQSQNGKVIENLETARGSRNYAGGHLEVLESARAGKVRVLVASETEVANPDTETAVRHTLLNGGKVSFVPSALLNGFAPIAAQLRY
jgi:hypothetical protein